MSDNFLVIDDSSTIHKVIELAFPANAVKVSSAESYAEAQEKLAKLKPNLIFADVGMLQENDFHTELKNIVGAVPVIVLVGSYDNVSEEILQAAGYKDFLKKPFDGGTLVDTVKKAYPCFGTVNEDEKSAGNPLDIGLDIDFTKEIITDSVSSGFSRSPEVDYTFSNPEKMNENSGLLTPILEKNMESWVKKAVSDYCELHFPQIARKVIQTELDNLLSEKERMLRDHS